MLIKLKDGRLKDVPVAEVTADNYIVPEGEEDLYHVKLEVVSFSPTTGKRLSVPRVQKFDERIYNQVMRRQLKIAGYTVEILHDPTAYIAEREERKRKAKEALKASTRKKTAEEQEKAFNEAVKKAVAEEIAKLSKISKGRKNDVDAGTDKGE